MLSMSGCTLCSCQMLWRTALEIQGVQSPMHMELSWNVSQGLAPPGVEHTVHLIHPLTADACCNHQGVELHLVLPTAGVGQRCDLQLAGFVLRGSPVHLHWNHPCQLVRAVRSPAASPMPAEAILGCGVLALLPLCLLTGEWT